LHCSTLFCKLHEGMELNEKIGRSPFFALVVHNHRSEPLMLETKHIGKHLYIFIRILFCVSSSVLQRRSAQNSYTFVGDCSFVTFNCEEDL
jgi:hypothetical protein